MKALAVLIATLDATLLAAPVASADNATADSWTVTVDDPNAVKDSADVALLVARSDADTDATAHLYRDGA